VGNLIEIQDLILRFYTYEGVVKALDGVDLQIREGETLGVVGETGCGKTMTGLSILGITPSPGKIEGGKVLFRTKSGKTYNLLAQRESALRKVRGRDISMIFQEPGAALNPVYTVENQIAESLLHHRKRELLERVITQMEKDGIEKKLYQKMLQKPNSLTVKILTKIPIIGRQSKLKKEIKKEVVNILRQMQIGDPERVADMYPFELSGGMQQRVVIAIALACTPALLIADEPTTSLDVTVQAQILELIKVLKQSFGSSVLYITHDMGVIAEICDRVAVMYAGNVCEIAEVKELFKDPLHPYTKALLESIPRPGKEFKSISGMVPNLINPPGGCRFHPRCQFAEVICTEQLPRIKEVKKEQFVACHLY
jgi:peptide/nickel transport system ATP-binding protein